MPDNKFYNNLLGFECDDYTVTQNIQKYFKKEEFLREYFIAITPRSGSSWLTELLASTHIAGNPEEWFNSDNLPGILKNYKCNSIEDYMKSIKANQCTANSVFGIEASFFQLKLVLEGASFHELFENPKFVYWTRKDFVSQGISLFKAAETGYFHSVQNIENRQNFNLKYDSHKIKKWILHILYQEHYWEYFFKCRGVYPLRLTYEDLVQDTSGTLEIILKYLSIFDPTMTLNIKTKHKKIANTENYLFQEQFRKDMGEFVSDCEFNRGKPSILDVKF